MPPPRGGERPPAPPDPSDPEAYRLVGVRPAATPAGCAGRDWLIYEIAQGGNLITGYRRGDVQSATADVEKIVIALNERRVKKKGRPGPKPKHAAAAAPTPAGAAPADPDAGPAGDAEAGRDERSPDADDDDGGDEADDAHA